MIISSVVSNIIIIVLFAFHRSIMMHGSSSLGLGQVVIGLNNGASGVATRPVLRRVSLIQLIK